MRYINLPFANVLAYLQSEKWHLIGIS